MERDFLPQLASHYWWRE